MNAAIAMAYALPGLPLGFSWWQSAQQKSGRYGQSVVLWITTLSYTWWFLPFFNEEFVGTAHSKSRFLIMSGNALILIICAAIAFMKRSVSRIPLGIACLLLGGLWAMACFLTTVRL
jgi:hypothetical protein